MEPTGTLPVQAKVMACARGNEDSAPKKAGVS
jgi:hypothetical protein